MGWAGFENGELLLRAEGEAFEAVITNDGGVQHEQNLAALPVVVIFLDAEANTLEAIRPLVPELLSVLTTFTPRKFLKLKH
jgi:hypothetical protein